MNISITNYFPFDIRIIHGDENGNLSSLGIIKTQNRAVYDSNKVKLGNKLSIYDVSGTMVAFPFIIKQMNVSIGCIEADSFAPTNLQVLSAEVSSINLINKLMIPIKVYHNGSLIGTIPGANSADVIDPIITRPKNMATYDNMRYGLKIGDRIGYSIGESKQRIETSITSPYLRNFYITCS